MNIVGKGKKVLDADLLARLAVSQQSGATVSKAEVKSAIGSAVQDMKDEFQWRDSSSGLKPVSDAIANTLELAIASGWVRGGAAKELISAFINGSQAGNIDEVVSEIRAEVRENNPTSGGGSVSYGGGNVGGGGGAGGSGTSHWGS